MGTLPALDVFAGTDVGVRRAINQDAALHFADANGAFAVLAVCDGLGGLEDGEVASAIGVREIRLALENCEDIPRICLLNGIADAHSGIFEAAGGKARMGTTVAAILITIDGFGVVHAGDSRAYRVRGSTIESLTVDHTWVMEQVAAGRMTQAEAESDSRRHVITRCLGTDPELEVDWRAFEPLEPGDVVFVSSDGLHGVIPEPDIAAIVSRASSAEAAVRALIGRANDLGGPDNISVVLARVLH